MAVSGEYPEPNDALPATAPSGSSTRQNESQAAGSSSNSEATSAYDDAFEQWMIDSGIYPENYNHPNGRTTPEPDNLEQLRAEFSAPRASLSLSQFSDSAFRDFKKKNRAVPKSTVKNNVIPIIAGNVDIPNEGGLSFTNLEWMTGGATVRAVPEFFDGARAESIHGRIRNVGVEGNLNNLIIPTKHGSAPVVPNFFFETKNSGDVAFRQAFHDGAIGTRAMDALQNYGAEQPTFDGNAYTYSSTHLDGHLKLFAHHSTAPATPGGLPKYHMTLAGSYALTHNRHAFVQGVTAFRNARDVAQRHRDSFIQAANARASQPVDASPEPEATELDATVSVAGISGESTEKVLDGEDDVKQQNVDARNGSVRSDAEKEPALSYLPPEDQELSQAPTAVDAEPLISFTTSSVATPGQNAKRTRDPFSFPSNSQPRKKHGRPNQDS